MLNKTIIDNKIICLIFIVFSFSTCSQRNKESDEPVKKENYFTIIDSTFNYNSKDPIGNLDKKNGFKNIFLGSNLNQFKLNPEVWDIYQNGQLVFTKKKFNNTQFIINQTSLESIKLIFFKNELISIEVLGYEQDEDQKNILATLQKAYGKAGESKTFYDITFGIKELENNILWDGESLINPIFGVSSFNDPTFSFGEDSETGDYSFYSGRETNVQKWRGEKVNLRYSFVKNLKEYFGKNGSANSVIPPGNSSYVKFEVVERFIISDFKKCKKAIQYYEKIKKDAINDSINLKEQTLIKETEKL